jgi:hypothetical protein
VTIPASTIPTAKLYLFNQITALINDPAVLVCYDEPGTNQPDDIIMVGRAERQIEPLQMVGSGQAGWLDEIYTIQVDVEVFRGGDDARAAFERACVLADQVVYVVRNDPSLGGAVIVARPEIASYEPAWEEKHLGRIVSVIIPIRCHARI